MDCKPRNRLSSTDNLGFYLQPHDAARPLAQQFLWDPPRPTGRSVGSAANYRPRQRLLSAAVDNKDCLGRLEFAKGSLDFMDDRHMYNKDSYWSGAACVAWAEGVYCRQRQRGE